MRQLPFFCILILYSIPTFAQRNLTDIPDPDPQKELAALRVPEGFEVNLFASDPDIAKPIQANWDARGRLWVASSSVYPQLEPGDVANDKIVILEDTNGDGTADKRTVFADGLLIPTGVLPAKNGAYVANSTELLFLEDTDGDDVADKRTVTFSGFGTEDTHHIIHTFRRGPGGYIYFNQSIYIHSNVETPFGPKRLDAGGIWRFDPRDGNLEVWARGFINPWGHRFDDFGQQFATDGAFGEGINYVFPGAAFVTAADAERILHGMSPGQPKHCGLAILDGQHLPEAYRGTFATADFRGHRVNRFEVTEQGSGYAARQLEDLLWSDHVAFRPIDVSMGPDGAVYVVDWYNPIIQHGEVDFRDPRRDKTHGRIWRITAKNRDLLKPPKLVGASPDELVAALKSDQRWTRDAARQLIGERGNQQMESSLLQAARRVHDSKKMPWAVRYLGSDPPVYQLCEADVSPQYQLELMWAMQSIGLHEISLWLGLPKSIDHRVRAAAIRVLSDRPGFGKPNLFAAATDSHPRVRLEAVNGLRRIGGVKSAKTALTALDHPLDENLEYALWLTARELAPAWMPEVAQSFLNSDKTWRMVNFNKPEHLVFALKAAGGPESAALAVALWDSRSLSNDSRIELAELIGRFGEAEHLSLLSDEELLQQPELRSAAFVAFLTAVRGRNVKSPAVAAALNRLSDEKAWSQLPEGDRILVAELIGRYRLPDGRERLQRMLNTNEPIAVRTAAVAALAADGRPDASALLKTLAETDSSPLQLPALQAWAAAQPYPAATVAAKLLQQPADEIATQSLVDAFLSVKNGPQALAKALEKQTISEATAAIALRMVSTSTQKADMLATALRTAAGMTTLPEELSDAEFQKLVSLVGTVGDAARGERIYRQESLQCVKCHAIGGAGGKVGPDLTSIGGSAQVDYLLESLVKPSAKIKEGYHTMSVITTAGTVIAGVVLKQTAEETVLRDNNGKEITIPAGEIEEAAVSPVSLMPTGLTTKLSRDELVDLVTFLSRLGKSEGYRVDATPRVRSWRVLDANKESSALVRANGLQTIARNPEVVTWKDVTTRVNGDLPLNELTPVDFFAGQKFYTLQFSLATPTAGAVRLKLPTADGVSGFVDGEPQTWSPETKLALPAGETRITLALEVGRYPLETIRVELEPVENSPAQARVVSPE